MLIRYIPYQLYYDSKKKLEAYLADIIEIKKSKLKSKFLKNRDQSLFAKIEFKSGDYVTPFGHNINQLMNDGLFDLTDFFNCNNVWQMT